MHHYYGIGLYNDAGTFGYVMDDFGNLIEISEYQFNQNVYIRTGRIL